MKTTDDLFKFLEKNNVREIALLDLVSKMKRAEADWQDVLLWSQSMIEQRKVNGFLKLLDAYELRG